MSVENGEHVTRRELALTVKPITDEQARQGHVIDSMATDVRWLRDRALGDDGGEESRSRFLERSWVAATVVAGLALSFITAAATAAYVFVAALGH